MLLEEALLVLTLASLSQISDKTSFLGIEMNLGAKCRVRGLNRLVVASEDIALFLWDGQMCNIFLGGLSSIPTPGRRCTPQHGLGILGMSCDKCNIRAANILVEGVHPILQISWILIVSLGRLVGPEFTRLL